MDGIRATWVRGGTSKCWVFETEDIEATGVDAGTLLPRLFGSPDLRQLDGIGGGSSTTSKAVLLQRSDRQDVDVDFTFAQVGIDEAKVDWGSNCGNCSTAAGLYAVEHRWVRLADPVTQVTTYNTNTDQVIVQRIPTPGGQLPTTMTATIPGAPFGGLEIGLGFVNPYGRTTGELLPTGMPREVIHVEESNWTVTLIDAGAPLVIVDAATLGLSPTNHGSWADRVTEHLPALDRVRRAAAVRMGMVDTPQQAQRAVPKLGIIGPSQDADADLNVLMLSMGVPHPAMPITGSVALTAAVLTQGTIVSDVLDRSRPDAHEWADSAITSLRLRTPAGVLTTFVDRKDGEGTVIGIKRTARTIARASIPVPASDSDQLPEVPSHEMDRGVAS